VIDLTSAKKDAFCNLIASAIEESQAQGREGARGAWLKQWLLRRDPDFDQADFGFATFREFVESLGCFAVTHDGIDIVLSLRYGGPPSDRPPVHELVRNPSRMPRVAAPLWSAFTTRGSGSRIFLDPRALQFGELTLYEDPPLHDQERLLEVPYSSEELQVRWVREWATERLSVGERDPILMALESGSRDAFQVMRDLGVDRAWLKARSRLAIRYLRGWAETNGLMWGPPLVEQREPRPVGPGSGFDLRALAHAAVDVMTEERLRGIALTLGDVIDALVIYEQTT
jgi:hypothetical protein